MYNAFSPVHKRENPVADNRPLAVEKSAADVKPYRRQAPGSQPDYLYQPYRATIRRAPAKPLVLLPHTLSEVTGPVFGYGEIGEADNDLTRQHEGEPLGERIIVTGRVLDGLGHAVPGTLVEIWQANAAGRYAHSADSHPAPLDPNFTGAGRVLTDANGYYNFTTIKPGAYPWQNHDNAWRPAHIHFSLFGTAYAQRLVTQMYFPGDPLFGQDPIFQSIREAKARQQLIAQFAIETTRPGWALGYRFDIILRGHAATPFEE